jgi:hypothetical protein
MSAGAAYYVPSMLLGMTSEPFGALIFRLGREEMSGGIPCLTLSAGALGHTITLWVAKSDYTLRKLFERDHYGEPPSDAGADSPKLTGEARSLAAQARRGPARPFTTEVTIEYFPVIDGSVAESRFDFTPPRDP